MRRQNLGYVFNRRNALELIPNSRKPTIKVTPPKPVEMSGGGMNNVISKSEAEKQAQGIQFGEGMRGSGIPQIAGLNQYSSAESSKIYGEKPEVSGSGKFAGEDLKKKLLKKLAKEKKGVKGKKKRL